jgi:hypothetical protein
VSLFEEKIPTPRCISRRPAKSRSIEEHREASRRNEGIKAADAFVPRE